MKKPASKPYITTMKETASSKVKVKTDKLSKKTGVSAASKNRYATPKKSSGRGGKAV